MLIAAVVCALLVLVVLGNIEAWRRRVTAEIRLDARRQERRAEAWQAMRDLDAPRDRARAA